VLDPAAVPSSLYPGRTVAALDVFARRIAGFDNAAVEGTKALLGWASLPADEEFGPGLAAFFQFPYFGAPHADPVVD
jgi:hypothetical protein